MLLPAIKDFEGDHATASLSYYSKVKNLVYLSADYTKLVFEPICASNTTETAVLSVQDDNSANPKSQDYTIIIKTLFFESNPAAYANLGNVTN